MAETQESVSDTKIANQPEDLNQDEKVSRRRRFVLFLSAHWRGVVCLITPLLFIAVLAPFPPEDTIIMFYGSMALAYAVEQSGLHKRVALGAIRLIGYSHYSNVTYNYVYFDVDHEYCCNYHDGAHNICCATSGIGTLVGSATNLVFKGLYERTYPSAPEYLSFPKYSAFSVPYMLILEAGLYFTLIVKFLGFLRPKSEIAKRTKIPELGKQAAKNVVEQSWKELGNITFWEIMVIILFSSAMLLFFCRSPQIFQGWGDAISEYFNLNNYKYVRDSAAALLVVFLMLLLPSTLEFFKNFTAKIDDLPKNRITSVLSWTLMDDIMPYSFMFLLGGGFALSEAAKKEYSDLNGQIGKLLKNLSIFPNHFIMLLIIIFTIFVTNFASNVAAKEINIHPLWYNIVSGVSASFCFCIPVGTPGNLIIQSSANIPTITMIKTGFWPSVATILITWFTMYYWAPVIWPDLISASPQDRYYMT
ncbi:hypothetical protein HF086_001749 [Spodoptera exigua]|uniref:Uncharacterized protein n=1 Tax=Spodoptera exigua TaxID=7107 RepID=A0A922M0P6_SPOEX|nr:hypothetical protein HF086_001749 [Spodoptera exigua]